MSGWRQVDEDTPTDGTEVLLWCNPYNDEGKRFHPNGGWRRMVGRFNGDAWLVADEQCGGLTEAEVALWAPLLPEPEAPS